MSIVRSILLFSGYGLRLLRVVSIVVLFIGLDLLFVRSLFICFRVRVILVRVVFSRYSWID